MCNLRDRIMIDMYGLEHNWVFNPYREVDEIADEDGDYTDSDAELDWDIRNDPDYDSHTYVGDE